MSFTDPNLGRAVNDILNNADDKAVWNQEQEIMLTNSRFMATNLATFFNTCVTEGIPSSLAEGMTYMMMGRFMSVGVLVQGGPFMGQGNTPR